ncbi:hypothetical protein [Acetobacter fallax]|uniref:Uncharacterized protein n=1 Tax=Acetobacter fallax TaxID=1737473 RepID=A0ABX0KE08_9PROT|nr:hypothetical protein [Acetobacter fallax]NHO33348.1 hypothetical protein [Acetobacter fallax]
MPDKKPFRKQASTSEDAELFAISARIAIINQQFLNYIRQAFSEVTSESFSITAL